MIVYKLSERELAICGTCTCANCKRKNVKPFAWLHIFPKKSQAICETCAEPVYKN